MWSLQRSLLTAALRTNALGVRTLRVASISFPDIDKQGNKPGFRFQGGRPSPDQEKQALYEKRRAQENSATFGSKFSEPTTPGRRTPSRGSGPRGNLRNRLEEEQTAANDISAAHQRAQRAKKEIITYLAETGATAEEISATEKELDAHAKKEIESRSKYGKKRVPLLSYKPGDLLSYHDRKSAIPPRNTLDARVILAKRVVKMTRGGKRPTQSALVVVGDHNGNIGFALGRAQNQSDAVDHASTRAARRMISIERFRDHTINYEIHGRFKRTRIFMLPAQPDKGLKCHHIIAKICELAGITDLTANVLGSQNPMNVVRATFECLKQQGSPSKIGAQRGLTVLEYVHPDEPPRIVSRHQPLTPRQTPLTDILRETNNWVITFPRVPWPAEFELARAIHDRMLRAKLSSKEKDPSLFKQIADDAASNSDIVNWLSSMPPLADPRGTLLYPTRNSLSTAAQAVYEKPIPADIQHLVELK